MSYVASFANQIGSPSLSRAFRCTVPFHRARALRCTFLSRGCGDPIQCPMSRASRIREDHRPSRALSVVPSLSTTPVQCVASFSLAGAVVLSNVLSRKLCESDRTTVPPARMSLYTPRISVPLVLRYEVSLCMCVCVCVPVRARPSRASSCACAYACASVSPCACACPCARSSGWKNRPSVVLNTWRCQ